MQQPMRFALVFLSAVALFLPAAPAPGDWLVTREGVRVETRGPWEVQGRLLVFTLPDGTLASMRASEFDLEASEQATAEAAIEGDATAEEESSEVVASLTDSDFRRRGPTRPGEANPPAEAGEGAAAAARDTDGTEGVGKLTVASWQRLDDPVDSHVIIQGTLRNPTQVAATTVRLSVRLFNADGELIEEAPAVLSVQALPPGAQGVFRAEFPQVFSFSAVKFDIGNRGFVTRPGAPAAATGPGAAEEPPG